HRRRDRRGTLSAGLTGHLPGELTVLICAYIPFYREQGDTPNVGDAADTEAVAARTERDTRRVAWYNPHLLRRLIRAILTRGGDTDLDTLLSEPDGGLTAALLSARPDTPDAAFLLRL